MAIWQFNVILVPRSWLDSGGDLAALGAAGCDVAAAWACEAPRELEARLTRVLSRRKSWQPSLVLWGGEQSDDVQLWRERGRIGSIGVRFDLRTPNMALFRAVADLAADLGFGIFVPEARRVIASDVDTLLKMAGESEAAHFVLDPSSFLSQIDAVNAKAT